MRHGGGSGRLSLWKKLGLWRLVMHFQRHGAWPGVSQVHIGTEGLCEEYRTTGLHGNFVRDFGRGEKQVGFPSLATCGGVFTTLGRD